MTEISTLNALKGHYAAKKFDANKKISSDIIETILEVGNLTATSLGIQPIKLVLIEDPAVIQSLEEFTLNQQNVQTCSHLLVLCAETNMDEAYVDRYVAYVEEARGLKTGALDGYKKMCKSYIISLSDDNKIDWVKRQAYIVMGNLLTVCASLGIDTCPMEGFNAQALDLLLNLKQHHLQSVLLLPLGYRATDDKFASMQKIRKPLEEMVLRITESKNV